MKKRYIVITGTTSGVGKELLKLYSANKNNIIFAGFRNNKRCEIHGKNIKYFYINLNDRKSIVSAAYFIKSRTNRIDKLINVAGSVTAGPIELIDTQLLREQFDTNVFGHLEFTQNLMDILEDSRIINISSMASFGHFPFISPYCSSKRAMDILFNALALENHYNIKVISIKPGVISTPIWLKSIESNEALLKNPEDYAKEMKFLKSNALKNVDNGLNVEKVAKAIMKIAAKKHPKSSYTIGLDAKLSELLSHLPQDLVNYLVKFAFKIRMGKP